eukprot:m.125359 g.125359  ORF g.125359 m.125359 type:complete len:319 (+) comp17324_c0_seq1:163-1119(+)
MANAEHASDGGKPTEAVNHTKQYRGMPIPSWFNPESAQAFQELDTQSDDVVLISMPKGGTTWMQKILHSMLRLDTEGNMPKDLEKTDKAMHTQIYPDAVPIDRPSQPHQFFGDACYNDLLTQPSPRLFSTHMWHRSMIPKKLLDGQHGKGKLIYVLRNPKDVCTSLHFFFGEPKDGWLGNEHGPGSFNRFIADSCPNAFGSIFDQMLEMGPIMDEMVACGRGAVFYYEHLQEKYDAEIARLAEFLGVEMTDKKLHALKERTLLKNMAAEEGTVTATKRKGIIGDWRNHLDAATWARMDAVFDARVGTLPMAQPLRKYM